MNRIGEILNLLPYEKPFLFVDEILQLDENRVEGTYRFRRDEYFYQGHFKNNPVTPGVILTECLAQIGVVCLGIYLVALRQAQRDEQRDSPNPSHPEPVEGPAPPLALTETLINFLKPVYPGEQVRVLSKKKYFRLGKLKCEVQMFNEAGEKICYGSLSGMIGNEKK